MLQSALDIHCLAGHYVCILDVISVLLFSELSLLQSRSSRIREAVGVMYAEATKSASSISEDILITTADEDKDNTKKPKIRIDKAQKAIEDTIHVIFHVKKIKRDLHIQ